MGLYKSTISKRSDKQWLRFKHLPSPPPARYVSRNGLTIRGLRVENLRVSDTPGDRNVLFDLKMTAVIQYILTTVKSFDFQDYYGKFLMTILELAGALFCENEKT